MTLGELATQTQGKAGRFRVGTSLTEWEHASHYDDGLDGLVRVAKLVAGRRGVRDFCRYLDPSLPVTLVEVAP